MTLFDDMFGWIMVYRQWRGGYWYYASCPDGGWMRRNDKPWQALPDEDYRQ